MVQDHNLNSSARKLQVDYGQSVYLEVWRKFCLLWTSLNISFPVGNENFTCSSISYFPQEKYQPDDQDSTLAIPCKIKKILICDLIPFIILDSARNSTIYFILSFIFLLIGEFFCFATFLKSGRKIFAFFSGISFVVGGRYY